MLSDPIQSVKGVGPAKAGVLSREAGIETVEDLLYYGPRRYLDRSAFKAIRDCFVNETVTISGKIVGVIQAGRSRKYLQVLIDDGTDVLAGVFFRGITYFKKIFVEGEEVLFSGKVEFFRTKQIVHPDYDFFEADSRIQSINTGRVIPLYPSTEELKGAGFDSRGFRRIIRRAIDSHLDSVNDPLDGATRSRMNLMGLREALLAVHFPETISQAEDARRRLSYNELLIFQYYLQLLRKRLQRQGGNSARAVNGEVLASFMARLPFTPTGDQQKAILEIAGDMQKPYPMNRLLQGDVGTGKTVVSMAAAILAVSRGAQVAVMAPTEILASQHYANFTKLCPGGMKISLLTGGLEQKNKSAVSAELETGNTDIIIGTHALIQEKVLFSNLGLIVIDEQHRFGVEQRAKLREKGARCDVLVMTATPIPRSLTLTLYGDLDVSVLRELPRDRMPVKTLALPESRIKGVYKSVEKYLAEGRQAFFIFPLVEESEKLDLKSATGAYESLKAEFFPDRTIGLLHGRMPATAKEAIMGDFKSGKIALLVSTTVIEVGIDVPNANVIVIFHAERFGLAQLHQLRGRVGRGAHQAFCVLLYPDSTDGDGITRINALATNNDGFSIAEEDLRLRGSGEFFGARQHGRFTGFEFADPVKDYELIVAARAEAGKLVSSAVDGDESPDVLDGIRRHALFRGMRTSRLLAILS
ncbi:MAG: ATP-dependent DNA helicase RecG [Spirochaetes bacterium]|nr:MAG: ATP-dependent DNA helicase RecG [Spirochaetota bacterium]